MGRQTLVWLVTISTCVWQAQAQSQDRYPQPATGSGMLREVEGGTAPIAPLESNPQTNQGSLPEPGNYRGLPSSQQPGGAPAASPSAPAATAATANGNSQAPAQPLAPPAADSKDAERLMAAMLRRPATSRLEGTPVSLHDVIATASSRSEQSARVNSYWDLCSAVSDYYLALHEKSELEAVAAHTGSSSEVMRGALNRLQRRVDTALTAAKASQAQLAGLMGRSGSAPLPGDMPLCVSYEPMFNVNFPNRAPAEAAALNQLLPLRHAELLDAASGVSQSEKFFDQVAAWAMQDLRAREAEVIKALQLLALNRRAFAQIARDYNRRITRYTELAKPGTVGTERLVAMLIKTDPSQTARTTAPTSPSNRRSDIVPARTFQDEDWEPAQQNIAPDEGVQPATYDQDAPPPTEGAGDSGETSVLRNKLP